MFWFRLGFISFGGPAGQIAIMHSELVEKKRWISESRFLHALNYCMLLPGPEAQQLATYLGWLMHKTRGGLIAGLLFILPSLLILIGLSWIYLAFGNNSFVIGIFYGIKPAVAAIVAHAAWRIGSKTLKRAWAWLVAVSAFAAIFFFNVSFPIIVICAAIFGFTLAKFLPEQFSNPTAGSKTDLTPVSEQALINQNSSIPSHARFTGQKLLITVAIGLMLWITPFALLNLTLGWSHIYTQMAWFFTKAALLTFGGAYAVLPYVYQGAVDQFRWLTANQMMDGLALGETTPGPLIMVVAFVGFVGGYQNPQAAQWALGNHAWIAGSIAACIVTWFTFLPSFIFILAGGPVIEASRNQIKLTAPLSAISAAVVGVIANLALFFASHVIWPNSISATQTWQQGDWKACAIALCAAIALFYFKRGIIQVLLACATIGLIVSLL
jgi:chromate transporter